MIWLNILIQIQKGMILLNKCEHCTFQSINVALVDVRTQFRNSSLTISHIYAKFAWDLLLMYYDTDSA